MKTAKHIFAVILTVSVLCSQLTCYAVNAEGSNDTSTEISSRDESSINEIYTEESSIDETVFSDNAERDTSETAEIEEISSDSTSYGVSEELYSEEFQESESPPTTESSDGSHKVNKDEQSQDIHEASQAETVTVKPDNSDLSVGTFKLPDIIDKKEATELGFVGRELSEEKNLNTFIFKNKDGTNTMKLYSHPVKYVDENGNTHDISLDIKENGRGGFITADNEIITTFEKKLSDGISLSYEDMDITMIPETKETLNKTK